jgi:heme/copper-type cytochrome/quinol oxidase subunit 2
LPSHYQFQEIAAMNMQTLILTVLIFWLIMGLAFLSAYSETKRTGGTIMDAMRNNETFFFIISIVVGLAVIAFKVYG